MLDERLDDLTRQRARATGIDWRNAWAGPVDGVRAWPDAAARALGVPAVVPDRFLRTTTVLEPLRREPRHASEMISEVRAGERLEALLRRDHWWLVAGEDSYVGWIHEWVLEEAGPSPDPVRFRYARPLGTLWISDHHAASPLWTGMPLWGADGPLEQRGGQHLVRTATGAEGWVRAEDLAPARALAEPRELLNLVRSLVGVPYRWGGRSPLGLDCSGLVQLAAQLCGALLPRDASQQAEVGEAVALDPASWEAGDLLFFGDPADHVGFTDGRGNLLHCQGRVRIDRLEQREDLRARLGAVRRWWGLRGSGGASAWTAPVDDPRS